MKIRRRGNWFNAGPITGLALLVVLTGLGFAVDLFASELPARVKVVVWLAAIGISLIVYYSQFYQPALRVRQDYEDVVLQIILAALLRKYKQERRGDYDLRANVMKVRRSWLGGSESLRIDFQLGDYSAIELAQEYMVDVGCSGTALAQNAQIYFDAVEAHETRKGMNAEQLEATRHVGSILSTPIYRPLQDGGVSNLLVAILNLDSSRPIAVTGFREDNLQVLAARYAALIGAVLQ